MVFCLQIRTQRLAVALCLWLVPALILAERLPVKTYTTADGLPKDQINRIVQDSRGFMWFATSDGLARFDGYQFTSYGVEQGLPSHLVADGSEIDPAWLAGVETVGLTAGASAPEELVLDVIEALRRHGKVEVEQMDGVRENIEFRLPNELRKSSGKTVVPSVG